LRSAASPATVRASCPRRVPHRSQRRHGSRDSVEARDTSAGRPPFNGGAARNGPLPPSSGRAPVGWCGGGGNISVVRSVCLFWPLSASLNCERVSECPSSLAAPPTTRVACIVRDGLRPPLTAGPVPPSRPGGSAAARRLGRATSLRTAHRYTVHRVCRADSHEAFRGAALCTFHRRHRHLHQETTTRSSIQPVE
jgi:hypothetical protein